MKKLVLLVSFLFATSINLFAQIYNPITTSDTLKAKKQDTTKAIIAIDSLSEHVVKAPLNPLIENDSKDSIPITKAFLGKKNSFYFMGIKGIAGKDYIPLAYSKTALLNTKVAFVGYGITVKTNNLDWDDYKGVDVKGKWVMILRGLPNLGINDNKLKEAANERVKVLIAEVKGASGVVFVTPVEMNRNDRLVPLTYDKNSLQTDMPVVNITRKIADSILAIVKKPLIEESISKINTTKKPASFMIYEKLLIATEIQTKPLIYKETETKLNDSSNVVYKITLGITPDSTSQENNGTKVDIVVNNSPASKTGIMKGDIITAIDGKAIRNNNDYIIYLGQLKKGQLISLDVVRSGQKIVLLVQL